MSINQREIQQLVSIARDAVRLIDATTIAITDLTGNLTRDQIAVLVNRAYKEFPGMGTPPDLSES